MFIISSVVSYFTHPFLPVNRTFVYLFLDAFEMRKDFAKLERLSRGKGFCNEVLTVIQLPVSIWSSRFCKNNFFELQ